MLCNISIAIAGDQTLTKDHKYSLNTGSFVYHAYAPDKEFTQYFNNYLFAIERKVTNRVIDNVVAGTLINSYGDRCVLLGAQKNWHFFNEHMSFEGLYAYAGEFFLDTFSDCGDSGPYHAIERATGIGFAPYIYHGIEYDINKHASLEGGVILPGIIVFTMQWHF
jgi:hypothetical protein